MAGESLIIRQLEEILQEVEVDFDRDFNLEVNQDFLDQKSKDWLHESFGDLGGQGDFPLLHKLKFDFKVERVLLKYDDEAHFHRYRLATLKSDVYSQFSFDFIQGYRRLCRTYERDCLKVGMQQRVWYGPPLATSLFGEGSEPGDFYGNGAIGWKLAAFNDLQMDLQSRLHGYKLVRFSPYETLMTGGSLRRIDQLLMNSTEETRKALGNWLKRKLA